MARLQENPFTSWKLSEEEFRLGSTLTELNLKLIQNEIADAALEKLNLTFDPTNPLKFAQQEAELGGKIRALQYLIDLHTHATQSIVVQTTEGD